MPATKSKQNPNALTKHQRKGHGHELGEHSWVGHIQGMVLTMALGSRLGPLWSLPRLQGLFDLDQRHSEAAETYTCLSV